MSYLARLKHEISRNVAGGELTELTEAPFVGFVGTETPASGDIFQCTRDQWREFEALLVKVAPAYTTPADQYAEIREAATSDLAAAIECYRLMAKQIKGA